MCGKFGRGDPRVPVCLWLRMRVSVLAAEPNVECFHFPFAALKKKAAKRKGHCYHHVSRMLREAWRGKRKLS